MSHATEYLLAGAAVAVAAAGAGLAWLLYVRAPELPGRIAGAASGAYRVLVRRYYVDEIYDAVFVRPLVWVADRVLFRIVDAGLIDGAVVNGSARSVRALAFHGLKYLQSGFAQAYALLMIVGAAAVVGYLLR